MQIESKPMTKFERFATMFIIRFLTTTKGITNMLKHRDEVTLMLKNELERRLGRDNF